MHGLIDTARCIQSQIKHSIQGGSQTEETSRNLFGESLRLKCLIHGMEDPLSLTAFLREIGADMRG